LVVATGVDDVEVAAVGEGEGLSGIETLARGRGSPVSEDDVSRPKRLAPGDLIQAGIGAVIHVVLGGIRQGVIETGIRIATRIGRISLWGCVIHIVARGRTPVLKSMIQTKPMAGLMN